MAFTSQIASKIGIAVRDMIVADANFAAYYGGRGTVDVYRVHTLTKSSFIQIPMMTIQSAPARDALNRMIGSAHSKPTMHLLIQLYEQPLADFIADAEINEIDILVHLELLLMRGSDPTEGDKSKGKLWTPGSSPTEPNPKLRYLNDAPPTVARETPFVTDLTDRSRDRDAPVDPARVAMVYPLVVTYETSINPITGART